MAVLEALALQRQGEHDKAVAAVDDAVSLARPGGWIRPFFEAGTLLTRPLEQLRQQRDDDEFIDRILGSSANPRPRTTARLEEPGRRGERPAAIDPSTMESLTNRELDILELLAHRMRSKEIADRLFISTHTVNSHLKRIYRKLGVSSRRQAVEQAGTAGLIGSLQDSCLPAQSDRRLSPLLAGLSSRTTTMNFSGLSHAAYSLAIPGFTHTLTEYACRLTADLADHLL